MFNSFFFAGFEAAATYNVRREWIDQIAATEHDRQVDGDYRRLREAGLLTAREAIRFLFASPAWHPDWLGPVEPRRGVDPEALPKFDVRPGRRRLGYVFAQLTLIVVVAFALLTWHKALSAAAVVTAVTWVLVSLVAGAALLEGRRWAVGLEMARIGVLAGAVAIVLLVPSIGPVLLASR